MKSVVNSLDNELRSSKARKNFSKKIGHLVKLMFLFLNKKKCLFYNMITVESLHLCHLSQ